MISLKQIKLKPAQLSIEQINTYINQSNTMTIEEANKLIDGELYLFKHDNKIIKRIFRYIESTENNSLGCTQFYLMLSTYEPRPMHSGYPIEQVELIGVYNMNGHQTERNGEML